MHGTFLASEVRILGRLLESHGLDPAGFCREAGIDYARTCDTRARVPFVRVVTAWHRAAELLGKPHLGLESAKFYRATDFHGLAVVFLASPTLRTALERLSRYLVVVNTGLSLRVETDHDSIDVVATTLDADPEERRAMEDSRASIIADLSRSSASGTLDPMQVEFTYPRPDDTSLHEEIFRCPLVFGASQWRMCWRLADANRTFVADNRELALTNDRILDAMVKSLAPDTLIARVKKAMVEELPSGTPSEDAIARAVGMSGRSLQRRLAEENTGFTALLAEVRRELARQYVEDREISVTDISFLLGFSDVSSFSRAFKRWFGRSPAAARQRGLVVS
jgi:AraC-like DNA-binding protein